MKRKIVKIDLNNKNYGGRIYENKILSLLGNQYEFKRVFLLKHPVKFLNLPWILWVYVKYRFFYRGALMLTNQTTWLVGKRSKNLIVIHHIDSENQRGLSGRYQRMCDKRLLLDKERFHIVVVVANYWLNVMKKIRFHNVHLIYNSFDPALYRFNAAEILDFKSRYGLAGKPVVYLGNCQKSKGVIEAFEALKHLDCYFVTTGLKDVEIPSPARHLQLSFRDYRLLLAASSVVVTMSSFAEGWNRTAHEALLCGTPVIGSGAGGMQELLEMGGGYLCSDIRDLACMVEKILENPSRSVPEKLVQFDETYFQAAWNSVLEELLGEPE